MTGAEPEEAPAFGPGGYLPPRASQRARKIVLRAPMGLGWPLAAIGAALVVILVGAAFLLRSGPPAVPYVRVATLADLAPGSVTERQVAGTDVLLVRAGGGLRVLVSPGPGVRWCAPARQLERGSDVWGVDGTARSGPGTPGLAPVPSTVYDGEIFADASALPSGGAVPASPTDAHATPACGG